MLWLACAGSPGETAAVIDTGPATCDEEGDIHTLFTNLVVANCQFAARCFYAEDPYGEFHCANGSHIGPVIRSETPACVDWCAAREFIAFNHSDFDCETHQQDEPGLWSEVFYACEERNY